MTPGLLAACVSFVLFLIGHVILFQTCNIQGRFKAMALLWFVLLGAYAISYAVLLHWLPQTLVYAGPVLSFPGIVGIVNGMVIYLLFFLIYCCLYFTDHSLSVAFMIELEGRPSRQMTRQELKERFPHDEMLRQRFADLIANGYVHQEQDHYRLAGKGLLFAGTLGAMKRFLKLEPGG
jgi:hypothetical protein